jgi:hypothetical protein
MVGQIFRRMDRVVRMISNRPVPWVSLSMESSRWFSRGFPRGPLSARIASGALICRFAHDRPEAEE